jgi:hypothetical protein
VDQPASACQTLGAELPSHTEEEVVPRGARSSLALQRHSPTPHLEAAQTDSHTSMLRYMTRRCVGQAGQAGSSRVSRNAGCGGAREEGGVGAVERGSGVAVVSVHTRGIIGWVTGADAEKKRALEMRNAELKASVSALQAEVVEHQVRVALYIGQLSLSTLQRASTGDRRRWMRRPVWCHVWVVGGSVCMVLA